MRPSDDLFGSRALRLVTNMARGFLRRALQRRVVCCAVTINLLLWPGPGLFTEPVFGLATTVLNTRIGFYSYEAFFVRRLLSRLFSQSASSSLQAVTASSFVTEASWTEAPDAETQTAISGPASSTAVGFDDVPLTHPYNAYKVALRYGKRDNLLPRAAGNPRRDGAPSRHSVRLDGRVHGDRSIGSKNEDRRIWRRSVFAKLQLEPADTWPPGTFRLGSWAWSQPQLSSLDQSWHKHNF